RGLDDAALNQAVRCRQEIHRAPYAVLDETLRDPELVAELPGRQGRQRDMIVRVRLKRHPSALHLGDAAPGEIAELPNRGGVDEELGAHPRGQQEWEG